MGPLGAPQHKFFPTTVGSRPWTTPGTGYLHLTRGFYREQVSQVKCFLHYLTNRPRLCLLFIHPRAPNLISRKYSPCPVGSRAGAVLRRRGLSVSPRPVRCLRCLLLVMCTHPFAKKALTLHLARSKGHERYLGCNLIHRKVLASSYQHLMMEAPHRTPSIRVARGSLSQLGRSRYSAGCREVRPQHLPSRADHALQHVLEGGPGLESSPGLIMMMDTPSLHLLRGVRYSPVFVRRLLGYYGPVRLPAPVRRCRAPCGFTARTPTPLRAKCGTSRLPCMSLPCVRRVSDHAGAEQLLR